MTEAQQRQYIRDHYLDVTVKSLAAHIGRSSTFVYGQLKREGLHIPPEITRKRRRESQFRHGSPPHNSGRPMKEWMSPEGIRSCSRTRFQPGHSPANTKHDGAVSYRADGYIWVRTSPSVWKQLHRVIWEAMHGPIPTGHLVQFKDGIRHNVAPDNLYLINRSDQAVVNKQGGNALPYELRKAIQLSYQIKKSIDEKQAE